jgi:hypothetical protein
VFSKYIRLRDKNICFTCHRYAEGSGYHAGHCIPRASGGLLLYFHEKNVNGQCYYCNINLGGNGAVYNEMLREKYGDEVIKELLALKQKNIKYTIDDYKEKIEFYKQKVKEKENG